MLLSLSLEQVALHNLAVAVVPDPTERRDEQKEEEERQTPAARSRDGLLVKSRRRVACDEWAGRMGGKNGREEWARQIEKSGV